ncbi:MAG: hypothetical protein K2N32_01090 [Clostridia bacterium]|nr:hypothetical protein [Clostridia bacterium]
MGRFHRIEKKLEEAINNSGMTEREIAKKMGIRRFNKLSLLVMYSLDKFAKISELLNLDANEILCLNEKKEENN